MSNMESNQEEFQGHEEGDGQLSIPAPEAAQDIEHPSPDGQTAVITEPADKEIKRPTWAAVLISVWIIGIYITFYYFLVTHWAVRYTIER